MIIRVCIQVAAGSHEKHRYNEKTLEYKGMSRVSRPYPYPYGFILGTSGADGDNVDCYLITRERMPAGTIVECEPIGLLEQDEDGEVDHKVLAALPSQEVEIGPGLLQELRDFIYDVFRQYPDVRVRVGDILPREAALHHIQACQEA
jgi:inorganic pyrophosphatase